LSSEPQAAAGTITLNGKPTPLGSALTTDWGGKALTLYMSTAKLDCPDVTAATRRAKQDERWVQLTLAPDLRVKAKAKWLITGDYFDSATRQDGNGKVADVIIGPQAVEIKGLDITFKGASRPKPTFSVKADIKARRCGRQKMLTPAADRPQRKLKVKLGSVALPIHGASLEKRGVSLFLKLSTSPHNCKTFSINGDLFLKMRLDPKLTTVKVVSVNGALVGGSASGISGGGIEVKAKRAADGATVQFTLKGSGRVGGSVGGYPLEIDGEATALACENQ